MGDVAFRADELEITEIAERLKETLAALSSTDRAELAQYLIGTLDECDDADVEAAWDRELSTRMQEIADGTVVGEPAADVFARLREKLS